MECEWDDQKAAGNLANHGVAFQVIENFDWASAIVLLDDREDYGEVRLIAYGLIGLRVHVCVYTERGAAVRLISPRKANRREVRRFVRG